MALALDPGTNSTFKGVTVQGAQDGDCCITPKRTSSLAFCESTYELKCAESSQPRIGMEFDSWEDGKAFYEQYAHEVGFSVRTYTQHKGEGGVPVWKRFVCAREGWRKKKDIIVNGQVKKPKRNVKLTRCGCEAMIGFKRRDDGKYEVARFVEAHKHLLVSPRKKQFLKSNVEVDTRRRHQNASTKRDLRSNYHEFKVIVEDTDAQTIIDTMRSKQRIDPSFFFDYQIDDKNKLAHIFWADSTSRKNYALFGDVVFFDSTYRTNRDDLVFAPFTGVNHHNSSVTFGAAFIANEKIESYTWLFKTFLEAMGGVAPKLIITNEDLYVKSAIRDACPNIVHRLCMWHILNELPVKVGCVENSNEDLQSQFRACVERSETPDEFDRKWSSVVSIFGLENNAWLTSRFEIRQSWVPAYFLGTYLSGISKIASRPEGESTFFGHISNRRLPMLELWIRLETDLGEQRLKELEDDNTTLHTLPVFETSWSIEMHARDVYTRAIFNLFQAEVISARDECDVQNIELTGEVRTTSISDGSGKIREVTYNRRTKVAECSCKLFESVGIPCSHIVIVLKREKINEIPAHYVLERWTKLATRKAVLNANGHVLEGPRTYLPPAINQLCSETCSKFNTGLIAARQCEEKMKYLHRAVDDAVDHVLKMGQVSDHSKVQEVESFAGITFSEDINVHPPDTAGAQQNDSRLWWGL